MTDLRKAAEGALAVMTAKPSSMTSADWKAAIDALRAALEQPKQDWSMLEAAKESLREHMTEIHRLRSVNAELLAALRLTDIDCQHLHHAHKDRHELGADCPVVARITAAIARSEEPKP
jgi:hypothetical protein